MQRDMDLVKKLLLRLEEDKRLDGTHYISYEPSELGVDDRPLEEVIYHLNLLIEEGFVDGKSPVFGMPDLRKLTWKGHEFVDDTRDPDIWTKTKERVKGLPSVGVGLAWEIAKAELRKKLALP